MLSNIDLNTIEQFLGPHSKKTGSEYIWQCPYCNDKSKNNLMYNPKKNVIFCFADPGHSKLLLKDMWSSLKNQGNISPMRHVKPAVQEQKIKESSLSLVQIKRFKTYQYKCNQALLKNEPLLNVLYTKRGITKDTVKDCGIGVDIPQKRFSFPSIKFGCANEVIGFEYRPLSLSKHGLYREKGTPTGLVQINSISNNTVNLVILEGYLDSYLFYQHLKKLGQEQFYHVATPSNGVTSIQNHFDSICNMIGRYKNVYLYLDSDAAGEKAMLNLKQKYSQIQTFSMTCGCKDFNEHYLKCLKGKTP